MKYSYILVCACLCMFGCGEKVNRGYSLSEQPQYVTDNIYESIPPNTSNLVLLGNGWATFDWNNRHFLYHTIGDGATRAETLTELK